MAKRKSQRSTARKQKQPLHPFDVYAQEDGSLAVLPAGDEPEYDVDPIWSGEAVDEKDAVKQARKSDRKYSKAAAANPDYEPNMPDDPRQLAEQETNRRLGITTRPARKSRKGTVRKTKGTRKSMKRTGKKKTTRRR